MMKSNKVLAALIGCMLTFSGVSFASQVSDWGSWLATKRAALSSWYSDVTGRTEAKKSLGEMLEVAKKSTLGVKEARENKEVNDIKTMLTSLLSGKEFSTSISKMTAVKNIREFFDILSDEKLEKQTVLQACNEKIAELESVQEKLLRTKREQEYARILVPDSLKKLGITNENLIDFSRKNISDIYEKKAQELEDYRKVHGGDFTSIELRELTDALKNLRDQMPR